MGKLFVRITDLISANINELIDKVEDPSIVIKQVIYEMEQHLERARDRVIDAIASEKQIAAELAFHRSRIQSWESKAEQAMVAGNEDMAKDALYRKHEHMTIAKDLETSLASAKQTSAHLKRQLRGLETRLREAKLKRAGLMARQQSAQAREAIYQARKTFHSGLDCTTKFNRLEDQVRAMEARSEAIAELWDDLEDSSESLEKQIDALHLEKEVIADFENLKKKLNPEP